MGSERTPTAPPGCTVLAALAIAAPHQGTQTTNAARQPARNAPSLPPPPGSYVIASAGLSAALLQWQAIRVVMARKKYRVEYPHMCVAGLKCLVHTLDN